MAEKRRDPVVVIGLGRFGSSLALELTRRGTEVLAIDRRPKVVQALAGQITHIATADATALPMAEWRALAPAVTALA